MSKTVIIPDVKILVVWKLSPVLKNISFDPLNLSMSNLKCACKVHVKHYTFYINNFSVSPLVNNEINYLEHEQKEHDLFTNFLLWWWTKDFPHVRWICFFCCILNILAMHSIVNNSWIDCFTTLLHLQGKVFSVIYTIIYYIFVEDVAHFTLVRICIYVFYGSMIKHLFLIMLMCSVKTLVVTAHQTFGYNFMIATILGTALSWTFWSKHMQENTVLFSSKIIWFISLLKNSHSFKPHQIN